MLAAVDNLYQLEHEQAKEIISSVITGEDALAKFDMIYKLKNQVEVIAILSSSLQDKIAQGFKGEQVRDEKQGNFYTVNIDCTTSEQVEGFLKDVLRSIVFPMVNIHKDQLEGLRALIDQYGKSEGPSV